MIKRHNFQLSTQQKNYQPVQVSQIEDEDESSQDSDPKVAVQYDQKQYNNIQLDELRGTNDDYLHQQFQFNHDEQQMEQDEEEQEVDERKYQEKFQVQKEWEYKTSYQMPIPIKQRPPPQQKRRQLKRYKDITQYNHSQSFLPQKIKNKSSPRQESEHKYQNGNSNSKFNGTVHSNALVKINGDGDENILEDTNLLKSILGIRLRQGQYQYLIEKNSANKAWKEGILLSSKGYSEELQQYNQFIDERIYCSFFNNLQLEDDIETYYKRTFIIHRGKLQKEQIIHIRGKGYSKKYEVFDHKIKKRQKRKYNEDHITQILEYDTLTLNKNLIKTVHIQDCERKGDDFLCTYWYDGKQFTYKINYVQHQFPKEIASYLYDRLKQKI